MRKATVATLAFCGGAALMLALPGGVLDAAKAKAVFQVQFGPAQVTSGRSTAFVLSFLNTGSATANLGAGDQVDLLFTSGTAGKDLVTALPPVETSFEGVGAEGLDVQPLSDSSGRPVGLQMFATGAVQVEPGESIVLVVRGAAGAAGAAPVQVNSRIHKKAAKTPKRLSFVTVKTPAADEEPFFGDGSAGPLVATEGAVLETLQGYTDVLIPSGVTVTVPSGATIRCTGTFENRGTIVVGPGGRGGGTQFDDGGAPLSFNIDEQFEPRGLPWDRGDSRGGPGRPAVERLQAVMGASGGIGLEDDVYSLPLSHYRNGGGGGSGALGAIGGDGGGVLRIVARGPVYNGGTIRAPGRAPSVTRDVTPGAGAGGGAGGIVILGSATSVDNKVPENANGPVSSGLIDVSGANGGVPDYLGGGGGGGGGGLVVFVAPQVRELEATGGSGVTLLDPGLNASTSMAGTDWPGNLGPPVIFAGGGGGGACVGSGGGGTGVQANGDIGPPPEPALPVRGQALERRADPRTLWN